MYTYMTDDEARHKIDNQDDESIVEFTMIDRYLKRLSQILREIYENKNSIVDKRKLILFFLFYKHFLFSFFVLIFYCNFYTYIFQKY